MAGWQPYNLADFYTGPLTHTHTHTVELLNTVITATQQQKQQQLITTAQTGQPLANNYLITGSVRINNDFITQSIITCYHN